MHIGKETLTHLLDSTLRVINECRGDTNIYKERRGIGQIAHTGIIRHHRKHRTVILKDGRLAQTRILKLQHHFILTIYRRERLSMCGSLNTHKSICCGSRETRCRCKSGARSTQRNLRTTANNQRIHHRCNLRNINLHEVIEGLNLVADNLTAIGLLEVQVQNIFVRWQLWSLHIF